MARERRSSSREPAGALGSALVRVLSHGARHASSPVARGIEQARLDAELGAGRALAAAFDLVSRAGWDELLARLASDGLEPSGAMLAAGGWKGGKKLHEETDDATWNAMLGSNLETARVSLAGAASGNGRATAGQHRLVGSRAAERPWESAKRGCLRRFESRGGRARARRSRPRCSATGVRVNVILPSTIDTPQNRAGMPNADPARWVTPESIADVAKFLLSDAARDVSGAALPVYGNA